MRKSGDKLWEKDLEHNTLTFLKKGTILHMLVLYKSKGY